jgi:hypothetical protein
MPSFPARLSLFLLDMKTDEIPTGRKHAWSTFKSPQIEQNSQSEAILSFMKKSLETCLREHDSCRRPSAPLPTRVLDVSTLNLVRLVEPSPGTVAPFIALSYCWGNGNSVTTTSTTIDDHRDGIVTSRLPQTLQDAVQLTRELGVQYLWIDALCIIQDSAEDWQIESAKMGSIYSDAHVTIAAISAPTAKDGFLRSKVDDREVRMAWPDGSLIKARVSASDGSYRDDNPWGTRGWTFQEKVLSTRIILYSNREAQWVCQGMSVCECGSATLTVKDDVLVADREAASTIWRLSQPSVAHRYWTTLVSTYSERSLTVETDRLPALSGIASTIADVSKSTYIAGLWKEDLLQGLFWSRSTPSEVSLPGVYRGPTFSWARVDGPVYCSNRDRDWDEKEPEFKVEVLDADATVDGKNPFGRLTHAQIKIRAPLFPCTVQKTAVRLPGETSVLDYFRPDVELCIVTKPGPSGPSTYPARKDTLLCMAEPPPYQDVDHDALSGDSGEQTSALLLYIGSGGSSNGPDSDPSRILLVLGPSPVQDGAYERLGLCSPSPVFPFEMPKDAIQEVVIV